jgi:hypothetical protein
MGEVLPVKVSGIRTATSVVITNMQEVQRLCSFDKFDGRTGFGNIRRCKQGDLVIICPPMTLTHVSKELGAMGWNESSLQMKFCIACVPSIRTAQLNFHDHYPQDLAGKEWKAEPAYADPLVAIRSAVRDAILDRSAMEVRHNAKHPCITEQVRLAVEAWPIEEVQPYVRPAATSTPSSGRKRKGRCVQRADWVQQDRKLVASNCTTPGVAEELVEQSALATWRIKRTVQPNPPWWKGIAGVDASESGEKGTDSEGEWESSQ